MLYDSTVLSALAKRLRFNALDPRWQAYERAKFQYQKIPEIAAMPEPTFMFAHILITHPPYVVDGKCNFKSESELDKETIDEAYVDTVECEGQKTLELIDKLQDVPGRRAADHRDPGRRGPRPGRLEPQHEGALRLDDVPAEGDVGEVPDLQLLLPARTGRDRPVREHLAGELVPARSSTGTSARTCRCCPTAATSSSTSCTRTSSST